MKKQTKLISTKQSNCLHQYIFLQLRYWFQHATILCEQQIPRSCTVLKRTKTKWRTFIVRGFICSFKSHLRANSILWTSLADSSCLTTRPLGLNIPRIPLSSVTEKYLKINLRRERARDCVPVWVQRETKDYRFRRSRNYWLSTKSLTFKIISKQTDNKYKIH